MYHSQLCQQAGYTIIYEQRKYNELFGVSTMEKKIFLFDVNPDVQSDWCRIEDLLQQADLQYCSVWNGTKPRQEIPYA